MIRVAICDDDRHIIQQITEYVQGFEKLCTIDTYQSGESIIRAQKEYDVIFLDIDMKGINGIRTAQKIRCYDKKVKIIYVTSYEDYRNYAFSVHAFGYLVKPVVKEQIHRQLKEALSYSSEEEPKKMLRFETESGITELDVKDIYYFEYIDRKIRMVTKGRAFSIRGSITEMGKRMESLGFCMPHKSFSVNLFYVKSIKGYDIQMMNESMIPLSQKKSVEFRERLSNFMANRI